MQECISFALWPVLLSSSGLTDHKLVYHHISDMLNHVQTKQLSTIYSLRMKWRPHHCTTLDTHGWFCSLQKANTKQYPVVQNKHLLYIFIYVGTAMFFGVRNSKERKSGKERCQRSRKTKSSSLPLLKDHRFIHENEGQELWRGWSAMWTVRVSPRGVSERDIRKTRVPQQDQRREPARD